AVDLESILGSAPFDASRLVLRPAAILEHEAQVVAARARPRQHHRALLVPGVPRDRRRTALVLHPAAPALRRVLQRRWAREAVALAQHRVVTVARASWIPSSGLDELVAAHPFAPRLGPRRERERPRHAAQRHVRLP